MTTITDNFNRASSDSLGSSSEGWSWTEVAGDSDIVSGSLFGTGINGSNYARAESDLSSDEHYAKCTVHTIGSASGSAVGVITRYSPSANTGIIGYIRIDTSNYRVFKITAGTLTQIGSTVSEALPARPFTAECESDSTDTHRLKIGGTTKVTAGPDAHAAGNKRTGLFTGVVSAQPCYLDDFEAADLSADAGSPAPYIYKRRRLTPLLAR